MIIVEARLIPHGDDLAPTTSLCKLHIINDGSGTKTRGNYDVMLYSKGDNPRIIRRGRIENWDRNGVPAWQLIAKAFQILDIS